LIPYEPDLRNAGAPAPVDQVTLKIAARIKDYLGGISDIGDRNAPDENSAVDR
jgi:hypothetical protein